MRLLLDTHLLLWAATDSPRLSPFARELIEDPDNTLWFSAASLWEVAIKTGLGRSDFTIDPRMLHQVLMQNDYNELAITGAHAAAVDLLPALHSDPFDRILVAQAQIESLTLLSGDEVVAQYQGNIRLI
ncbi:MAG: type II toxin-antitoxin system VapC family toxin [Chloroflexi bacterium]|nr:type II toxin-antitoxin system VapC family toxin [Chloroflexota bacterium]MYJ57632.1 type II toxin-antitoxin system VapC family toxin [Chloroflexota bacterium]